MSGIDVLDIDIGNTRAKWRLLSGQAAQGGDCDSELEALLDMVATLASEQRIAQVRIASVKDQQLVAAFMAGLEQRHSLPAVAVSTASETLGVQNSYRDPGRMGVDRWCAVIAAAVDYRQRQNEGGVVCVVDAGSALTLDIARVDGSGGEHLGGYIVPGYRMQLRALLGGTQQIAVADAYQPDSVAPGTDTESAVCGGILASLAALVNTTLVDLRREYGVTPLLYITGGDGPRLQPLLNIPAEHHPELVLDGIALLAGEG